MARRFLIITTALAILLIIATATVVIAIRSGLQRYSDQAVNRFPGDRSKALMQLADCAGCPLTDRNHAVWALGQIGEKRSISVLRKHHNGEPCNHSERLCQYELRKAIHMIETADQRTGPVWRLIAGWHRPWR